MQSTQQKHCIPTNVQSRPLFGTGIDKSIVNILCDDFVFSAPKPGKLEKIDEANEIAILKYDDGTQDIIDLSEIIAKNSNGGFFTANKKELMIKEGQRFKKDEVLAKNGNYFKGNTTEDTIYSTGRLCKIAVVSSAETFEDSSMISSKMSKDMTSKITMKKEIALGVNSNIDFLIKKGEYVKTGDKLVVFDTSFEDSSINFLLGNFDDEIDELTKNEVHSKYTGRIVDVNLYYNHDIGEYTPSVQKILKKYIADNKTKVKTVEGILDKDSTRLVNVKSVNKLNTDKVNGKDIDGLFIEIFIEYEDSLSVGDKVTYATALKTTISDVFEPDEAPFTEFTPHEDLDAIFPSLSIVSRQTTDFYFHLYLNKAILGMKEHVRAMWEGGQPFKEDVDIDDDPRNSYLNETSSIYNNQENIIYGGNDMILNEAKNMTMDQYIESLIKRYNKFDGGHQEEHARIVIKSAVEIAKRMEKDGEAKVNMDVVRMAAAYHDIGNEIDRENHHKHAGAMVRKDKQLRKYFNEAEIEDIARACEEHRASYKGKYSSVYSRIISDADRTDSLDAYRMIRRSFLYNKDKFPNQTPEERFNAVYNHLVEKYGYGGYANILTKYVSEMLDETRKVLANKQEFIKVYKQIERKYK